MLDASFGLFRTLDCSHEEGTKRIRVSLADQGFGILTEIDLSATMKKKLGKELVPYLILGACHPPSAWTAVQAEPAIGLLLPCNVVVTVDGDGQTVLGAIDPGAMFQVVDAEGMDVLVEDVRQRLQAALDQA
jgi:uncharacterized protein (DUF302 family)